MTKKRKRMGPRVTEKTKDEIATLTLFACNDTLLSVTARLCDAEAVFYLKGTKTPFKLSSKRQNYFFILGVVGRGSFHSFQNMGIATLTLFARNDRLK